MFFATPVYADELETIYNNLLSEIVYPAMALVFALALIYFLWGTFKFVKGADSDDARSTGKQHMVWGVIGMAIMASAFGIVEVIRTTVDSL